jgi:uncharacterized protein (TIGR02246 family)
VNDQLAFLLAESGIRQLWARYSDAVWRKDFAAFGDCFTEDAVWKIAGMTVHGRAEIVERFAASVDPSHKVMLRFSVPLVTIVEGGASARTQVSELIKRNDGSAQRTLAVYYDRCAERDGVWRFRRHHFNLYYLGPPDLSAPYLDVLEYGPPPGFPGDDDPTPVPVR